MAARLSAKKLPHYSLEFKLKAIRLTRISRMSNGPRQTLVG